MPYNKGGFIVLLTCVTFSFAWFAYLVYLSPAIDLDELDSSVLLEDSGVDLSTYWVTSEGLIVHGQKVYQTYCASCHGPSGLGDGAAGRGLTPPPRNLIEGEWQKGGGSIELYKTLVEGIEGTSMVSFSYLSTIDRWTLVHYVRSITNNKVQDDEKQLEEFAKTAQ